MLNQIKEIKEEKEKKRPYEIEDKNFSDDSLNKKRKIDDSFLLNNFSCSNFYIDKSLLIKDFLDESSDIICVTRPSNYGKTVNLNMLYHFFKKKDNVEDSKKYKEIFENLKIGKVKNGKNYIDKYQGKFSVVYINFDELKIGNTFEETIENFNAFIIKIYENYESIEFENFINTRKKKYEGILGNHFLIRSFEILCYYLNFVLKEKVVLLIDNYDSPILKALNTNFYNTFYNFYEQVLTSIFEKNRKNRFLFKTFITGKINISFFKKFNSKNYSVDDNKYNEYYSITDSELKNCITKFKLENNSCEFEKYCNYNS
eukprot:jgi/Orpsp1_1/1185798/evm.model.c7180000095344.1